MTAAEELERVIPAIEALKQRFDLPISVDTWRASVLREALGAGAVVGNDISGFADPDYLSDGGAGGCVRRRDPHPDRSARPRSRSHLRRAGRRRGVPVPARPGARPPRQRGSRASG